jgi:hypothetical protein
MEEPIKDPMEELLELGRQIRIAEQHDYSSFEELTQRLHLGLISTGGDFNRPIGFIVRLMDEEHEKDVIYSQLCKLSGLGIFLIDAQVGLTETKQQMIDKMKILFAKYQNDHQDEIEDNDDLYDKIEKRSYLECYMKRNLYEKLTNLNKDEFLIHGYEYRFGCVPNGELPSATQRASPQATQRPTDQIPVHIGHVGGTVETEITMATNTFHATFSVFDRILNNTSVSHKQNIMTDLYHVFVFDNTWNRPTALFDALVKVLE